MVRIESSAARTETTMRGQPDAFVDLNVHSRGKFHTASASSPPLLIEVCDEPLFTPCKMCQSSPYTKL